MQLLASGLRGWSQQGRHALEHMPSSSSALSGGEQAFSVSSPKGLGGLGRSHKSGQERCLVHGVGRAGEVCVVRAVHHVIGRNPSTLCHWGQESVNCAIT